MHAWMTAHDPDDVVGWASVTLPCVREGNQLNSYLQVLKMSMARMSMALEMSIQFNSLQQALSVPSIQGFFFRLDFLFLDFKEAELGKMPAQL